MLFRADDISILMDRDEVSFQYPQMSDSEIAEMLLAKYVAFGIVPLVVPPDTDLPPMVEERVPVQNSTDRALLSSLAKTFSYQFYVRPGLVPLTNVAYWGPPVRTGLPKPALSMDLGPSTNIDRISFSLDATSATQVFGFVQDDVTEERLPLPLMVPDRFPPLAALQAFELEALFLRRDLFTDPRDSYLQALVAMQTQTNLSTDDVVTVEGELDTLRYGAILDIPGVVDVRGAGWSYDGRYVVREVRHSIQRGAYKQSFKLAREGTGSLDPVVLP